MSYKKRTPKKRVEVYIKDAPYKKASLSVPENLYELMQDYIEKHPDMDISKLVRAAVAKYLEE